MTVSTASIKLGLERIRQLLHHLGNPHLRIPIIHVAGTNGKGSVCAFQAQILKEAGFRVGRFTSPFLIDPSDSINLDGSNVDHETFRETRSYVHDLVVKYNLQVSSFELLTAIAFELFSKPQAKLDLAVIEVGLGGAKDATNVCSSHNTLLSCITPISVDHQAHLGSTVQEIANHKAGIAKPQVPILMAQQSYPEVEGIIRQVGRANSCDVFLVRPYQLPQPSTHQLEPLPLLPHSGQIMALSSTTHSISSISHPSSQTIPNPLDPKAGFQHQNAATAATSAYLLRSHPHSLQILPSLAHKITDQAIVEGLNKTKWPGRLELVNYKSSQLLLDGAHNQASAKLLGNYINLTQRPITLIISLSSPRDPNQFIDALGLHRLIYPPQLIITTFSVPEDMQWVKPVCPQVILNSLNHTNDFKYLNRSEIKLAGEPGEALKHATSMARNKNELIVVCGSLYLISDVIKIINNH